MFEECGDVVVGGVLQEQVGWADLQQPPLAHHPDAIREPANVAAYLRRRIHDDAREHFVAIYLDGRHRPIADCVVSIGTATASLVHPREVFRPALREAAAAVILVHNHPSGDPAPSREDREVTERLVEVGEILGVPVLDHVIVAERGYVSLRQDEGLRETRWPASSAAQASSRNTNAPLASGR